MTNRKGQPSIEVVTDVCRDASREVLQQYTNSGGQNYGPANE